MRTNIDLDDDLIAEAMKHSRARTKKALVEEALVTFIATRLEEKRRQSYRDRLQDLRARTRDVRLRSDTRDILREYRESR